MAWLVVHVAVALLSASLLAMAASTGGPVQPGKLDPQFYDELCPHAQHIVASIAGKAHYKDPRMAASLLRLHFRDCFVKAGCDASLLDIGSGSVVSEKRSNPNKDSAGDFEVIDEIKAALEAACQGTVSCADILALAARDSNVMDCLRPSTTAGDVLISGNINTSMSPQAPTPEPQPGNANNATKKLPKWLVPLAAALAAAASLGVGGYIAYKIYNNQNCECFNNILIQIQCLCCHSRGRRASVSNSGSELMRAS